MHVILVGAYKSVQHLRFMLMCSTAVCSFAGYDCHLCVAAAIVAKQLS